LTEAFKVLSSLDLVQGQQVGAVLYVEDESDSKLLRAWAQVLRHPALTFLRFPFVVPLRGKGNLGKAKGHFQCLRLAVPTLKGLCIVDGDSDGGPGEGQAPDGLVLRTWPRYEAENYLINPDLLKRFVGEMPEDLFTYGQTAKSRATIDEEFGREFPAGTDWKGTLRVLKAIKGSEFLVEVMSRTHLPVGKRDLYMLAEAQLPDEIPADVVEMLDAVAGLLPAVVPAVASNESAPDEGGVEATDDSQDPSVDPEESGAS